MEASIQFLDGSHAQDCDDGNRFIKPGATDARLRALPRDERALHPSRPETRPGAVLSLRPKKRLPARFKCRRLHLKGYLCPHRGGRVLPWNQGLAFPDGVQEVPLCAHRAHTTCRRLQVKRARPRFLESTTRTCSGVLERPVVLPAPCRKEGRRLEAMRPQMAARCWVHASLSYRLSRKWVKSSATGRRSASTVMKTIRGSPAAPL